MSDEETEEFFKIKELFFHLNQMIHVAGSKESYQMLFYLPDTDPNFHKLELVKGVRKYLRESLTPEIEKCVDTWLTEYKGKMREENSMQYLSQKLYQTQLHLAVNSDLETSLQRAIAKMSERPIEEIFLKGIGDANDYPPVKSSPLESNDVSLNSSFNQSGYLFINPSQYINIAESLKKRNLQDNFHNALDLLLAVTPGEPVSQTNWPSIRKSLKELLHSENEKVFDKAIRFHSRLLSSQVYNAVKEGFLNIVEALSELWLSRKLVQRLSKNNPNLFKDKTFCIMFVLIDFLKEFPALWIRYPTQYVSDMVDAFFNLFEFGNIKKGEVLSFFDILSFLDPKGLWFHSWVHGQLGRRITLHALKNKITLLSVCISNSFLFIETSNSEPGDLSSNVSLQYLEFFKFNHSLNVLFCIIQYAEGRLLFPVYDHVKKDHYTLKKCLHGLAGSVKLLKQHIASKVLLQQFVKCCNSNENLCKLFCEIGIVDSLIKVLDIDNSVNKFNESETWYLQSILNYFAAVNSTSVGHEYLLTGKLQKPTSKIVLTSNVQTPAQILFHFTNGLIAQQHIFPPKLMQLSFNLSCSLLQSPLGRHLFLNHPLIGNIILYLQEEFGVREKFLSKTLRIENRGCIEEYFEFVIEKLLLSHKGMLLLEKSNVLVPVLNLTLPQYSVKGKISFKLLTRIVCSVQGCIALGRNQILKEYWTKLQDIAYTEPLVRPPLHLEEMNDIFEEALIPLSCILSTFEGTKLLYSEIGLLSDVKEFLLDPEEQETVLYSLVLKILGASTYNLDGMLILEMLLNLQENLSKHQKRIEINGTQIIDENAILRDYILRCLRIPKGTSSFDGFPFPLDDEMIPEAPASNNAKEKGKIIPSKRQGELLQFLNDTRGGAHDGAWLIQCRRAFRSELLNNEEIKVSHLMEMTDLCLDSLLQSPDETLPYLLSDDVDIEDEIPSPMSSSFNNTIYCYPPAFGEDVHEEPTSASGYQKITQHIKSLALSTEEEIHLPSSLGIEIMIRYGSELSLIPDNDSQRSNLLKLKLAVDSYLVANKQQRYDWLSVLVYYMTAGNVDKSFSFLRKLKNLKVGAILWPSLMGSLWIPLKVAPNELLFSSIIHCTKLVLYRDSPTAFLALEDIGGGIIWNIASEWINQSFVGILPWPENLYIFLVALLFGGDYLIYSLACLLLNLHKILIERTTQTEFKKIMFIQTMTIQDWKIKDNFLYMDTLCKRFRRIILDTIYSPLTKAN